MTGWRSLPRNTARLPVVSRGFTLTELAIAFVIIALVLGGLALTLSVQNDARKFADTQSRLETAKEALIGFAMRNGRLPCPASDTSNGEESPVGGGACTNARNGFLPGATLGLPGGSNDGRVLDAWDEPIRYAISTWNTNAFSTSGQIAAAGITGLNPDLRVCSAAGCGTGQVLSAPGTVVAVVYSLGRNRLRAPSSSLPPDEAQNQNGDDTSATSQQRNDFVSHEPRPAGSPGGEFDDLVTWIPLNTLVSRLVAAGTL
jgi:type II secretory pathway pseudopilin PulG